MTVALLKYENWDSAFLNAERDKLGVLSFAKKSDLDPGFAALLFQKPWFAKTWVIVVADASVVAFLFAGFGLLHSEEEHEKRDVRCGRCPEPEFAPVLSAAWVVLHRRLLGLLDPHPGSLV